MKVYFHTLLPIIRIFLEINIKKSHCSIAGISGFFAMTLSVMSYLLFFLNAMTAAPDASTAAIGMPTGTESPVFAALFSPAF